MCLITGFLAAGIGRTFFLSDFSFVSFVSIVCKADFGRNFGYLGVGDFDL